MLRRLNDALPGLILGILVYGIVVELTGIWFVADRLRYTTGLLIGIALACGMAVNMAVVLQDAVDIYGESRAQSKIIAKSILRYLVVVIVFFVMMKWDLGNPIAAFIGVLGLKVSAYLQPFAHKFFLSKQQGKYPEETFCGDNSTGLQGRGDVSSDSEDKESYKEVKL